MNEQELKDLKKGIILTASYYGRDLKPEVIQMMAEDLSDLPFQNVSSAYISYRRDAKNRAFPLPAQIRELVSPTKTPESESREIIDSIKKAVRDFGYMQASSARQVIGEVGWEVVRGMGGWDTVCNSDFILNPALTAQARTRAHDLISKGSSYNENQIGYEPMKAIDNIINNLKIKELK